MAALRRGVRHRARLRRRLPDREDAQVFRPARAVAQLLAMLPMAVPGLVLGLGYIFFFNAPVEPAQRPLRHADHAGRSTPSRISTPSAHLTAVTALKQIDAEFEAVSASLKVPFWRTFGARHGADLHAGDPRHRRLLVRQRDDDGLGGDLPLRARHQARLDRDRAHGRGRRHRRRRRHGDRHRGDRDRRQGRRTSCSTGWCSSGCRPGGSGKIESVRLSRFAVVAGLVRRPRSTIPSRGSGWPGQARP